MVSTNKLKNGMTLRVDGDLWRLDSFQHVKPGKGGAFVRTTLKGVVNGKTVDRTFRADEDVEQVRLERRPAQVLFREGEHWVLMDAEHFEQQHVASEVIGEAERFMREGDTVEVLLHDEQPIAVQLPASVDLEVAETDPGVQGDRVSGGSKPATLETGAVVQVPLFIEPGERITVDTRSGDYLSRA